MFPDKLCKGRQGPTKAMQNRETNKLPDWIICALLLIALFRVIGVRKRWYTIESVMDLEKLLSRVKSQDVERQATLKCLQSLCINFVSNIPFETCNMFGGEIRVWDLEKVYDIVVEGRRGGFCCDLNGLLQWVLTQFGFKVQFLKAYVCEDNEKFTREHMAMMVTLENGARYLTDIGWGGSCFTFPLEMTIGKSQSQPNGVYRLGTMSRLVTVEKKRQRYLKIDEGNIQFHTKEQRSTVVGNDGGDERWNIQFGFEENAYQLHDFEEIYYQTQLKNVFMVENFLAVLQSETGRKFFFNNLFYEKKYVNPETIKLVRFQKCTIQEMYEILESEFGIKLGFELKLKKFVA